MQIAYRNRQKVLSREVGSNGKKKSHHKVELNPQTNKSFHNQINFLTMNTKQFKKANDFFKVVGHPVAQKILSQIEKAKEPITSGSIYKALKIEQSQCSQMLGKLRGTGLVNHRKDGKKVFYTINRERMEIAETAASSLTF